MAVRKECAGYSITMNALLHLPCSPDRDCVFPEALNDQGAALLIAFFNTFFCKITSSGY
jgi:hypothetical protein